MTRPPIHWSTRAIQRLGIRLWRSASRGSVPESNAFSGSRRGREKGGENLPRRVVWVQCTDETRLSLTGGSQEPMITMGSPMPPHQPLLVRRMAAVFLRTAVLGGSRQESKGPGVGLPLERLRWSGLGCPCSYLSLLLEQRVKLGSHIRRLCTAAIDQIDRRPRLEVIAEVRQVLL